MSEEQRTSPKGFNARQKLIVVLMDLALLAELTFCIYLGKQNPENMTVIFLKTFIPMVIGTLAAARILIRRNAST